METKESVELMVQPTANFLEVGSKADLLEAEDPIAVDQDGETAPRKKRFRCGFPSGMLFHAVQCPRWSHTSCHY